VRGLDLSNMTLVEGDACVIVIDPLVSTEVAAAAPPVDIAAPDMLAALSVEQARYRMTLSNGALIHWPGGGQGEADLTLTLTKPALLGLLAGGGLAGVQTAGDAGLIQRLLGLLDQPDPGFPIVTP
jgi:alkyl sulfatase BDS1-like metallo-beta-lactamase superfamily hydrolase